MLINKLGYIINTPYLCIVVSLEGGKGRDSLMGGGEWTPTCFIYYIKHLFGGVRIISYLCLMKTYLKTPTSELTTHQIRTIVCETIRWCETNLGIKSRPVNYCVRTFGVNRVPLYGRYDSIFRTITVYKDHTPTVKSVVKVVLHEYTHYLQNLRWYNNVLSKVGYNNHPQEKEARMVENRYSNCWNDIKNKI
jgi:hypothetical protein